MDHLWRWQLWRGQEVVRAWAAGAGRPHQIGVVDQEPRGSGCNLRHRPRVVVAAHAQALCNRLLKERAANRACLLGCNACAACLPQPRRQGDEALEEGCSAINKRGCKSTLPG